MCYRKIFLILIFLLPTSCLLAVDRGQWADADPARQKWFQEQRLSPEAKKRLGVSYDSCCSKADVYKTKFRVGNDGGDDWEYLDKDDNTWKLIPRDIINPNPSIDGDTLLFRVGKIPVCFYKPNGGIQSN